MEAIAIDLYQVMDERYVANRISSIEYLGKKAVEYLGKKAVAGPRGPGYRKGMLMDVAAMPQ